MSVLKNKNDIKLISNELFVNLVKYGKIVQSLYDNQLKEKYCSFYKQFLQLEKQLNNSLGQKEKNVEK